MRFPTFAFTAFWVALAGVNFYIFMKMDDWFQYVALGMVVFSVWRAFRMLRIGKAFNDALEGKEDDSTDA